MVKHSIEPDEVIKKPATLAARMDAPAFGESAIEAEETGIEAPEVEASAIEAPAVEAPEVSAPATGTGTCFAISHWEHEADRAHAGMETGASGATVTLGLKAYAENVCVGTESQVVAELDSMESSGAHRLAGEIEKDVDGQFREAQRNLAAASEGQSASVPEQTAAVSAPTVDAASGVSAWQGHAAGQGGRDSGPAEESKTARHEGPSSEPRALPKAKLGSESFGVKDLNRLLGSFKGQKFDCMDCSSDREVAGPASSPDGKKQTAQKDAGFDPDFYRKKTQA